MLFFSPQMRPLWYLLLAWRRCSQTQLWRYIQMIPDTLTWLVDKWSILLTGAGCYQSSLTALWTCHLARVSEYSFVIFCLFVLFLKRPRQLLGYIADGPQDKSVWQFWALHQMRQSWETMPSVPAGHIILALTQPVGSGRPQRESNSRSPY